GGMVPSPPMMLSALAQRTKRVTLGPSIIILPLHNPIEIAEQLAMLDLMSNGRAQLGIGRGFVVYDYEALGMPYECAQERTVEGLEVILKAWSGQRFNHEGQFYRFEHLEVWPPVQQRPHPPVWMSASSNPLSFEWIARQGYNLLTIGFVKPVPKLAELTRIYRQASQDGKIGTLYHVVVCENSARARELASTAVKRFLVAMKEVQSYSTDRAQREVASASEDLQVERFVDEARLIAGNPAEVVDMLRYLEGEIGFTQVDCMFQLGGLPFEVGQESMQLFAAEVMPKLREQAPVGA
ncbi:MAG TPA: LLM class flavin-dependent oxidoreductase, partial [Chloroflexota bacterium]